MQITDQEIGALRAYLLDADDADQRIAASQQANELGFASLFAGAFAEVVRRRFASSWSRPDVIRFVASARAGDGWYADLIEPRHAEQLLRTMLGDADPADLNDDIKAEQAHLLPALVDEANLDEQDIDELLAIGQRHAETAIAS